jgi:2-keto-myo-inositol isomerase
VANELSRRAWLAGITATAVGASAQRAEAGPADGPQPRPANDPFTYCLNTSTISGQKLTIVQVIDIAAKAGYQGIEPWIRELDQHVQGGGSLADLRKRIQDAGLRVESAIGFCEWIVDDDNRRKQALEAARRDMDKVRQIGGARIAAPPVGATKQTDLSLARAAERYRALCEVGERLGVVPQVEVWGFSTTLGRLGEAAQVAIDSGHPQACILADVYHLYKGGSSFAGLRLLNGAAMHCFHMNDYPAQPSRAEISDAQRVHCGDGVAPLTQILRDLRQAGFRGALSLELFNRDYWKQDALQVARTGLEKMRAAVRRSLE